jgi:hypothetical protein
MQAFNAAFGTAIDRPQLVRAILGTELVRLWYQDWRMERADERNLPEDIRACGMTPAEWAAMQNTRAAVRQIRAETARRLAAVAADTQRRMRELEASMQQQVAAVATPMTMVVDGNFEHLTFEEQLFINNGDTAGRDRRKRDTITVARARWLEAARAGAPPY